MKEFRFHAKDEAGTEELGRLLADVLSPGSVIALVGTLGAGKTRLVQAVATAMGVPRDSVTSPTFVLVNEYVGGRLSIYHFDTYRLRDEDEFIELGPEEYFASNGVTFVEWADRFENCLPAERLNVQIEVQGANEREFIISADSDAYQTLIRELVSQSSQ